MKELLWGFLLGIMSIGWSNAQVIKADIGVNGLTCSQCSRSVYHTLNKLDFVEKVEMDLNETIAHVTFKNKAQVDFEVISRAIRNAGYSVRNIVAELQISDRTTREANTVCWLNSCFVLDRNIPKSDKLVFELLGDTYNADKELNKKMSSIPRPGLTGRGKQYFGILK